MIERAIAGIAVLALWFLAAVVCYVILWTIAILLERRDRDRELAAYERRLRLENQALRSAPGIAAARRRARRNVGITAVDSPRRSER